MEAHLLSVCLITYNHSKYIRQAIEGVLMQETSFHFDLFIADDFSTDGTRQILIEYKNKFPDKIKLIFQKKNVGPAKNWLDLITTPKSKYIAYFEGDDYWTDKTKLQKQIEFLEKNPEYSLCFHNVTELLPSGKMIPSSTYSANESKIFSLEDLALTNFIHTPTVVYRNVITEFPDWFIHAPVGDYPFWILLAEKGKIFYFPDIMTVYRKGVGIWSNKAGAERIKKWLTVLNILLIYFTGKNNSKVVQNLESQTNEVLKLLGTLYIKENINNADFISQAGFTTLVKSLFYKLSLLPRKAYYRFRLLFTFNSKENNEND